jgi:hypothetical protein
VTDRELETRDGAHRVAEHIGRVEPDGVHERCDIIGQILIPDGPIDVGGAAVSLEFERIHAMRFREHGNDLAHRRNVHVRAMQHDERVAGAGHLVVHLHAIDLHARPRLLRSRERGNGKEQRGGDGCCAIHGSLPVRGQYSVAPRDGRVRAPFRHSGFI